MRTVGSILKKARMEKEISLEEAEKAVKIRKSYLEALEASDYSKLPSAIFIKGFLKTYCTYLGLKEEEVTAFWRREYDEKANLNKNSLTPPQPLTKSKLVFTPGLIIGILALLGIIGFLIYIYTQYSSFALSPVLMIDKPADQERLKMPFTEVIGRTNPEAIVTINGQEIRITESGAFTVNVDLAPGENTIEIMATNKLGRKTVIQRKVVVEAQIASEPPKTEQIKVYTGVELDITADPEAAWISVEEDGIKTYEGVLNAKAKRSFTAKETIKVRTGKASSTKITLNGKDLGAMGTNPDPLEREYQKP